MAFPDLDPTVASKRHPLYDAFHETWLKLIHVREGTGGFVDGTYLHAHPREWLDHSAKVTTTDENGAKVTTVRTNPNPKKPSPKLLARRRLASYTNHAAAILDTKKSALFREAPIRRVGSGPSDEPTEIEAWWENVDGRGCSMDDLMPGWWDLAATLGHLVVVFDLPNATTATTAADQGQPYLRAYTPLDVLDWLENDDGEIISVKLVEAVQATTYDEPTRTEYRIRIVDTEGWQVYNPQGNLEASGQHNLGTLPVGYLYGKRRSVIAGVGDSILGDPRNHIDLYNLRSELRELQRNQTFSFINVPLGTGQDSISVEAAQQMLGQQTGAGNVLFSGLAAQVLSGDTSCITSYQDDIKDKTREIYREAGAPWESDSRDAEASKSLEIKREELNTRLAQYADECEVFELRLTELWYRWKHGADRWKGRMEEDQVSVQYPDKFGSLPFEEVMAQIASARDIGMPPLFMKVLRRNVVSKFEGMGSLSPDELQEILDAIDEMPDDPTPQERMRQRMELMDQAAKAGQKPPAVPPDPAKA